MNKKIVREKVDSLSILDFDRNTIEAIIAKLQDIQSKHGDALKLDFGCQYDEDKSLVHVLRERGETDKEYHKRISAENNLAKKNLPHWML